MALGWGVKPRQLTGQPRPMTVRLSSDEEAAVKRLAEELETSISDVLRRGLAVLVAEDEERRA